MLKKGFNRIWDGAKGLHFSKNCQCMCDVCLFLLEEKEAKCKIHLKTFAGTTTLWQEIVCPKPKNEEWHALQCVIGTCYDISKLWICL